MKVRAALCLLAAGLMASCDWSPPRDNPRDPASPDYSPPEAIRGLQIETHCYWDRGDICSMTVFADVYDPEGISTLDSAWVYLGDTLLGQMGYDAVRDRFVLTIYGKSDILHDPLPYYQTKYFVVRFRDDARNIVKDSIRMTRVIDSYYGDYPELVWPAGEDTIVTEPRPWFLWWGYAAPFPITYRVDCHKSNGELFWDSSGISQPDTTVQIGVPFAFDSSYSWTLTVVDEVNNTARSVRERFWVFDIDTTSGTP